MNSSTKSKLMIIALIVIGLVLLGYIFRNNIIAMFSKSEDKVVSHVVNRNLQIHKEYFLQDSENSNNLNIYNSKTLDSLYSKEYYNTFYPLIVNKLKREFKEHHYIIDWDLTPQKNKDGSYTVIVTGVEKKYTTDDPEKIETKFIVKKDLYDNQWRIADSYNYLIVDAIGDSINVKKSDIEKYKILSEIKDKIGLNDWTFDFDYVEELSLGNDHSIVASAECKIVNYSTIPIYFAKVWIEYYGESGYEVLSDIQYLENVLLPGETASITSTRISSVKEKIVKYAGGVNLEGGAF